MGHWYTKEGDAKHYIESKVGALRATTLRDARKLGLVPSVTEVLKVVDRPALTRWKVEQAYLAAMTLPRIEGESLDDFIGRARVDAEAGTKDAINIGEEMHAAVEAMYKGDPVPEQYAELVKSVYDLVYSLTGITGLDAWQSEHTFAAPDFGGMIDLHTRRNGGVVIDFKSKDFLSGNKKPLHWPEMDMQLSAYAHGIGLPKARRINIFLSRTEPGLVTHHEWEPDDDTAWRKFRCLLDYWKLDRNYCPEDEDA